MRNNDSKEHANCFEWRSRSVPREIFRSADNKRNNKKHKARADDDTMIVVFLSRCQAASQFLARSCVVSTRVVERFDAAGCCVDLFCGVKWRSTDFADESYRWWVPDQHRHVRAISFWQFNHLMQATKWSAIIRMLHYARALRLSAAFNRF